MRGSISAIFLVLSPERGQFDLIPTAQINYMTNHDIAPKRDLILAISLNKSHIYTFMTNTPLKVYSFHLKKTFLLLHGIFLIRLPGFVSYACVYMFI